MLTGAVETYPFQPCDQAPFNASSVVNGGSLDWSTAPTPDFTADGDFTFEVRVDFSPDPVVTAGTTFSRDTLAPVVTVDPVTTPTNDNTPTFEFDVTDANEITPDPSIECAMDASGKNSDDVSLVYAACESPFTAPAQPDGPRALYVRSLDKAGLIGYGAMGVIIDTVLPTIFIASPQPNQELQSSVPELNIAASDPNPGTGVSSLLCRYDAEALVACNDGGFLAKALAHGAHSLTVQATDGASNVATAVVPFSVNTSLDIVDPTVPARVKAKKLGGKVKGSKYRLKIRGSFAVPAGFDPAVTCKGTVRFSISGRLKRKKTKTFRKNVRMKASGRTCVYTTTFSIPKAYKRKRLVTRAIFKGNTVLGGFSNTAVIRKA